jgi:transposase
MARYELTDFEWKAIEPHLPNKPRGVPRVDDRRVLNGIFWVLRSGAPWGDLPEHYGPRTTVYNRFNRWRKAGVWDRLMDAIVKAHDGDVQMIDTSIVRVHQQGATAKRGGEIDVWAAPEAGSRQKSTRWSTRRVDL